MQKKCAVILCEAKCSEKGSKRISDCEILFRPMIDTVVNCLEESGIKDIFVLKNSSDKTEKLRNFISNNKDSDLYLTEGTSLFSDAESVTQAYKLFEDKEKKTTAITSPKDGKIAGIWMTAHNFKKNCPFNSSEKEKLSELVNYFNDCEKYISKNEDVSVTVNNCTDLYKINEYARKKVIFNHMNNGVIIPCIDGVIISPEAEIGPDTVILKGTIIKGASSVGSGCEIGPDSLIENSQIGDNTIFNSSQCYNSKIGCATEIGPYVRVRPNCVVGDNVRVGNFVELKNSNVDDEAKISHLSYIGDSDVGKDVNIGCGCATVNFDGVNKHRTKISDGSFIGCGVNLVAPVTVGVDAFVAAGSTIVEDIPDSALAIARNKQYVKHDWVKVKKPYRRMRK